MARLTRECVVTEKIDGTNAQVYIEHKAAVPEWEDHRKLVTVDAEDYILLAGSRTRWITPQADNFGFARWCFEHAEDLLKLGPGRHFGEWWGLGIQRGYGLKEKRFSLFNTSRWVDQSQWTSHGLRGPLGDKQGYAPECCSVVPVLYQGLFSPVIDDHMITKLKANGSFAAPGFMDPEGVVIYHVAAGVGFKKTIKDDEVPKGLVNKS